MAIPVQKNDVRVCERIERRRVSEWQPQYKQNDVRVCKSTFSLLGRKAHESSFPFRVPFVVFLDTSADPNNNAHWELRQLGGKSGEGGRVTCQKAASELNTGQVTCAVSMCTSTHQAPFFRYFLFTP